MTAEMQVQLEVTGYFCSNPNTDALRRGIGARILRGGGGELGNSKILTYGPNYLA
jgi:hypothetical protein